MRRSTARFSTMEDTCYTAFFAHWRPNTTWRHSTFPAPYTAHAHTVPTVQLLLVSHEHGRTFCGWNNGVWNVDNDDAGVLPRFIEQATTVRGPPARRCRPYQHHHSADRTDGPAAGNFTASRAHTGISSPPLVYLPPRPVPLASPFIYLISPLLRTPANTLRTTRLHRDSTWTGRAAGFAY